MSLENFSAAAPRPAPRPTVDTAEMERALTRARSEAHARGYEEGAAAAMAAGDAELRMLLGQISEALADHDIGGQEARSAVLRALHPLIRSFAAAISPALARAGLAHEIADRLDAALRHAPQERVAILVAPEMAERLRSTLAPGVDIRPDPERRALEARIVWASGFDEIDLEASMAGALTAVDRFLAEAPPAEDTRKQTHG
ncbi:hypothetical protein FDP22_23065 (plasmid) [Paroceanicella profunda]|uniref:Flagellar assembly protein FliH/Type III secretion system HrpE domain-containing protein n=1 Tax=Paroceanicella profunda TaxID=2579971 RepID=A0A5B8G0U7_9RHOB|nr:hypothetical protein [Paroceanicella profunda]QDL94756.1 hypothetical protein FDP22_23065 [Paroceanicella profunda]